jgi:hypothetical protein
VLPVWLRPEGRDDLAKRFMCTVWQAKQASDFVELLRERGDLFNLNVHGPGLLSHMLQLGIDFEEANWARLSPAFRAAHNRLRQARGVEPLPEPKIDLYVPPRGPRPLPFDPTNREFVAATREFLGQPMMGPRGGEGFEIRQTPGVSVTPEQVEREEGFWVDGKRIA